MIGLRTTFCLAAATVGLILFGSLPSNASTYTFDFSSDTGYDIVGTFTTGSADGPGFDITSISGSIISANSAASSSILGLVPGNATPPSYLVSSAGGYGSFYFDNIFLPTAPYFSTTGGLLFKSSTGFEYNLYGGGGCCNSLAGVTYLSTTDGGISSAFYPGIAGAFTVADPPSPVPVPAALQLFATGLAGLGLLEWRRKRKSFVQDF